MDTTCYTFPYIPLHHYSWCSGLRPRPCRISCRQNIYFCLIRRLIRQKYHFLWLIGSKTSCCPNRSVILLVINIIAGSSDFVITRMITDRTGFHSVLLPLQIVVRRLSVERLLSIHLSPSLLLVHRPSPTVRLWSVLWAIRSNWFHTAATIRFGISFRA